MHQVAQIILNSEVRWRIHPDSPLLLPPTPSGERLLNPLLNEQILEDPTRPPPLGVGRTLEGEILFASQRLLVLVPPVEGRDKQHAAIAQLVPTILLMLVWLRVMDWQTQIPNSPLVVAFGLLPTPLDEVALDPMPTQWTESWIVRDVSGAATSYEHLIRAWALANQGERPPLSGEVFADAVTALNARDFRRSLLDAAIAVEAVAGEHLERLYRSRLSGSTGPEIRVARTGETVHDPVYEYLSRPSQFRLCLHERPLYLSGRSLLIDRKADYDFMLRLYATRNRIAHGGTARSAEGGRALPETAEAAAKALVRLHSTFQWFGANVAPLEGLACMSEELGVKRLINHDVATYGTRSF